MYQDWETPSRGRGRSMNDNEVSLIYSPNKYYTLTFNRAMSLLIMEHGYSMINIKQDDITGEIGLEINNEKGIRLASCGIKGNKQFNLKMDNKEWAGRLCNVLNLSKDGTRHILKISNNLSKVERCMFYRLSKK